LQSAVNRESRARAYVAFVMEDPPESEVTALAAAGDADDDHARWELRYARRAFGLLIAQRDALDDRTASEVAAELERAHAADPRIAADRRHVSARQFNERLTTYGAALNDRTSPAGTSERLGRALLAFSRATHPGDDAVAFAADVCATIVAGSNLALQQSYGEARLPTETEGKGDMRNAK
jgi:hypothetical protein